MSKKEEKSQSIFGQRLKQAREDRNLTQSDLAKLTGIGRNNFSNWEVGPTQPSKERIYKIAKALGVTFDYLVGEDKMSNMVWDGEENELGYSKQQSLRNANHKLTFVEDPVQAGYLDFTKDSHPEALPKIYIPNFNDCDTVFVVEGDSMFPSYSNGDFVICRKLENPKYIEYGHPHVLAINGRLTVKRIFKNHTHHTFTLKSDNTFYQDFEIEKEDLHHIWVVRGSISKNTGVRSLTA